MLGNGRYSPIPLAASDERRCARLYGKSRRRGRSPRLDLGAGEALEDGIIMGVDVDVIVDAHPGASAIRCIRKAVRQRFQRRAGRPPRRASSE